MSAEAPTSAQRAAERAEVVVLALRGDQLPREALQRALAQELGREILLEAEAGARDRAGVVTVNYRQSAGELAVTWDGSARTVSRVIAAPDDLAAVIEASVLLAGNLAREQVDELVPARPEPLPPRLASNAHPAGAADRAALPVERPPPAEASRALITAGVLFPLATHHDDPETTTHFDVNLLYGRVGAVEGVELGAVNVVTRQREAWMNGLQLGALGNVVMGEVRGVQLASLFNVASEKSTGLQLALGMNLAERSLDGVQGGLLFNRAGRLRGAQVGAINVAGDVDGLQLGVINVARNLRGVSIGLVNVADDIEGVPLAPISVTRSGGVHPAVWSGSRGYANAGVKFATRRTYTLFFGSTHRDFERDFVGGGLALGGRIRLGSGFHSDIDVGGTWLIAPSLSSDAASGRTYHEQLVQPRVRMLLGHRFAKHFGVFVGGAAMGQIRSELDWDRVSASVGPELAGGIEL